MYLHSSPILRSFFIILFLFLKFHRAITNVDRQNGEIFDLTSPPRPVRPSISQLRFSILQSYPAVSRKNFKLFNSQTPPTNLRHRNTWLNIILLLSGDLHPNPGPVKYPCGICSKPCTVRQKAIACDGCDQWHHLKCIHQESYIFRYYSTHSDSWHCFTCGLPNFSSGFFNETNPTLNSHNPFGILSSSSINDIPSFDHTSPSKSPSPLHCSTPKKDLETPQAPKSKTQPKLTILNTNFQSLWPKKEELSNLAYLEKADVIIGTETWLPPDIENSELLLNDYDISRRDRNREGGGVMIAIKKNLNRREISKSTTSEVIFCAIDLSDGKQLVIGAAYRPCSYTLDQSAEIVKEIYDMKTHPQYKNAVFWLGGDLNLPDIDWTNQDVIGKQYTVGINLNFLEMSQDLGLSQIVDIPTRGPNILDIFFTNHPLFMSKCQLIAGLSDHEIIKIETSLHPRRKKPAKRKIQLWSKVDETEIKKDVLDFKDKFVQSFSAHSNINLIWTHIKTEISTIINKHVPTKMTTTKIHQPWINAHLIKLIRKKNRWFRQAKESKVRKCEVFTRKPRV